MNKLSLLAIIILGTAGINLAHPARATDPGDATAIPQVSESGRAGYVDYVAAQPYKAFAIAPGGAWAWVSGNASVEGAEADALAACRRNTEQPCHLYAVDDQVVFDEAAWTASWDLHSSADQVAAAPLGTGRGDRFPDMALTAPDGRAITLSQLQGKPVFLHFWGSWCPPCQTEFSDLQQLHDAVLGDDIVAFVLVQGQEPISRSRRWADRHGFTMPLYDSGHQGRGEKGFRLADGTTLGDRRLASVYPTTYILDANGLVVFHQAGPGKGWKDYEKLIRHIAGKVAR